MPRGSLFVTLRAVSEIFRISAPTVVDSMRSRVTREVCTDRLKGWSKRIVAQAAITVEVHGLGHAEHDEAFVVMSNHQSHYDIPVILYAFPRALRFVAKTELFRIPIFAGAMRAAEMIEVDRGNTANARKALRRGAQKVRSGISVWIAPEGTRSPDGRLGPFKKGGFALASEAGVRILPVTIVGTREVLPAHDVRVRRGGQVRVVFHAPIDPKQYGWDRRDALVAAVKSTIASALPEEQS
jgi:1-acyl-sn-glycerol-3-phosphate acyltransferase